MLISSDRAKPAIGYIVATGGGLFFVLGWHDGVWAPALGGVTLFLVSCLYIALCYGMKALNCNDAGVRAQLDSLAEAEARLAAHRAELAADMESWRNAQQIQVQETMLAQHRLSGLAQLLDDTRQALAIERATREAAQQELADLSEEHNLLIQEVMQQRNDRFVAGRPAGPVPSGRGNVPAARRQEHGRSR